MTTQPMAEKVYFFDMHTDPSVDLFDDDICDALYEAGCDDAVIGHHFVGFARQAETWEEALRTGRADAESVPGVKVVRVTIDASDIEAIPATGPARRAANKALKRETAASLPPRHQRVAQAVRRLGRRNKAPV